MSYNVAVLGATGAVGHEMLTILEERNFPIENIYALASKRSVGKEVSFGDKILKVENVDDVPKENDELNNKNEERVFSALIAISM